MNSKALTRRIPLDRPWWLALRCAVGWHMAARYELRTFTLHRKEGRKQVEFELLMNVQEAICCGKVLDTERVA